MARVFEAKGLTKRFDTTVALDAVDLTIDRPSIVAGSLSRASVHELQHGSFVRVLPVVLLSTGVLVAALVISQLVFGRWLRRHHARIDLV